MMRKLIVMIAFLSVAAVAKAQEFKIGYTFLEFIVFNMPEMESISSELETYEAQLGAQIEAKQKDIQTKYAQLQQMAQQPNANQVVLQEKENELINLQEQLQKFRVQADQAYRMKETEKINPVYAKVQDAIEAVRKENGFALILNSRVAANSAGIVLAADESLNITELVFKKLGVPMPKEEPSGNAAPTGNN
ncbi:OmpH family outer membrane protein [Roseivirga sp. UBA1976]|uniref:OmpH family outer membrane protein n=1 Tax=Roseivirga sp. UBA1976 TaxID=1947386 RepID=UPI002580460C|nr:OmpH family outer membrane protein [Roseivirga sp. UBA1976]MEC7755960.1 OmpH family outer membrane protein [Bacteroidota bacterium]|tara:strand:+ start:3501 stop:4076 length:576 start_codon:yes stop_codon:yes gene_type:complete